MLLKKIAFLGIAAISAVGILAAPAVAGKKDDTLNVAFEKELESLDWYYNTAREGIVISRHVYDQLIFRDPETFEYKPLLATSWKWLNDTEMELELRQDVTFHNGAKFSADDVVYVFNYAANPDNKVKYWSFVNWIKEVEKIDDYKIKIIMHEPFPAALEYLANALPVYPKDYYAEVGPKGFGVKPIGTGPYKVTEVEPGKKIVLEKNENYFEDSPKGKPAIGKIVWRTMGEVNTKMAELITGGLDWCWFIPQDQASKLADKPKIEVVGAETMRVGFLFMDSANMTKDSYPTNPFLDLKVRQAVNHAINRPEIAKFLVGEGSRPVYATCYPSQFGCTDDVVKYEYDPEKAKKLLAEAGYPDGFTVDFFIYRDRPYAEAVVGDLAQVGIKANLTQLQYSALREKAAGGGAQLAFWTWGSNSLNDVSAFIGYWLAGTNDDMAKDPEVIALINAAKTEMDVVKREELYNKALQLIAERALTAPMFTYVNNNCFTKDLNFTPYPDAVPRFYWSSWK
ncbi:ABC transporter substrate-binding protein [bacterium]|nr:ABC transporter substrate-binding protein [bacterium]